MHLHDTIVALSTPQGTGAIGVIRLSGPQAIDIAQRIFSRNLDNAPANSVQYGKIKKGNEVLDEVVLSLFRAPHSYTRQDVVEISFHGSPFILSEALQLLVQEGARLAQAGEFTQRAFLNGALDLAQAEAVADLIASSTALAHKIALRQMRGGVSSEIKKLRQELLDFVSLIELELDFGEEDVEFADRTKLIQLIEHVLQMVTRLAETFRLGNAIRNGIPVVIAGRPNAGKSTLLNSLLGEDRALVSDIPGTTRDTIEENLVIEGVNFRLIDTAGIREAEDQVERMGVSRTMSKIQQATLLLYLYDATSVSPKEAEKDLEPLRRDDLSVIVIANKSDEIYRLHDNLLHHFTEQLPASHLLISARNGEEINKLKKELVSAALGNQLHTDDVIISNARHATALTAAGQSLASAKEALTSQLPADLVAIDIRHALHHLGEITGEITTDEVLGNIFSKFCIGK